jgi:hypothetical protein
MTQLPGRDVDWKPGGSGCGFSATQPLDRDADWKPGGSGCGLSARAGVIVVTATLKRAVAASARDRRGTVLSNCYGM